MMMTGCLCFGTHLTRFVCSFRLFFSCSSYIPPPFSLFPFPFSLPPLLFAFPLPLSQRYFGTAIGKGARAAKTDIEKYKFQEKTVEEALGYVAKILVAVHDDAKDKPMEVELSTLCAATGWRHEPVSDERRDAAVAWARAQIEAEEAGSDDDDE